MHAAYVLTFEFDRLKKQRCGYCDGWGHSGNDCPTDKKIDQLRGGVKEQDEVLTQIRKEGRKAAGMAGVTGFSLLSADPKKTRPKRKRVFSDDGLLGEDRPFGKRIKFA